MFVVVLSLIGRLCFIFATVQSADIAPNRVVRERGKTVVLPLGSKLTSKNGRINFEMREDGNLVLYCAGDKKKLWSSGTEGSRVSQGLYIESNGNLMLYDENYKSVWSSNTRGYYEEIELVVQDDNNVILYNSYDSNRPVLWSTKTSDRYCPDVEIGKYQLQLVDASGNYITNRQSGLLLFNRLTLCKSNFNLNAAHAVCKLMGFEGALSWKSGNIWRIQEDYDMFSHSLACSGPDWSSCSLKTNMKLKACNDHTKDVFLTCSGDRSPFTLVNFSGSQVSGHQQFLLLYNGGTVCGDHFNDSSADAICRDMGYAGAQNWRTSWPFEKSEYNIALDDVKCSEGNWKTCTYTTSHNCVHSKDIYLSCRSNSTVCPNDHIQLDTHENAPTSALWALICIAWFMYAIRKNSQINRLAKEKADVDTLVKKLQGRLKKLQKSKRPKSNVSSDDHDDDDDEYQSEKD